MKSLAVQARSSLGETDETKLADVKVLDCGGDTMRTVLSVRCQNLHMFETDKSPICPEKGRSIAPRTSCLAAVCHWIQPNDQNSNFHSNETPPRATSNHCRPNSHRKYDHIVSMYEHVVSICDHTVSM